MKAHQLQRNQKVEGLPDAQPTRPRRFRIVKLEERIAPKSALKGNVTKKGCTGVCDPYPDTVYCW